MKLFLLLFSVTAFASTHHGSFSAQEMTPILVWEHNEWVRKGSEPIYDVQIEYEINIDGEVTELKPALTGAHEIDKGFGAESLLRTFFASPTLPTMIYTQNTELKLISVQESSVGPGIKHFKLTSEWTVIDSDRMDEIFRETIIADQNELHFDQTLTKIPLSLEVSVGQKTRLLGSVKIIGRQSISAEELKAGTVRLNEIKFSSANQRRSLIYFFNWGTLGPWPSGNRGAGPYIVIER